MAVSATEPLRAISSPSRRPSAWRAPAPTPCRVPAA
jgi:hypothetical protein